MSILNICKSLIINHRFYGASSFLSHHQSKSIHDCVLSYAMKLLVLGNLGANNNSASERLVLILSEKMDEDEKRVQALLADKSEKDIVFLFENCCNSLNDIKLTIPLPIFKLFVSASDGSESKQVLSNYLLDKPELIRSIDESFASLFSEVDPRQVRTVLNSLDGHRCPGLKIILLEKLISKNKAPYWELYNLAIEHRELGKHREALSYYEKFYELALLRGEQNPTKHGLVGILRSFFYVSGHSKKPKAYFDEAPASIQEDKDIQTLMNEFAVINECQSALKQKKSVDEKLAGYQYLNKLTIQEHVSVLTKAISVAPSHQSFYELFKLQAMLNNKEKAKELLKNAYQANTLLLSVG